MRLFTSKSRHLIGVDVCATSVKLVDIQRQQGMFHLKSYGIERLPEGIVVDKILVDTEAVGNIIASLVKRCQVSNSNAATAVSGSAVITKIIDMDTTLSDVERDAQIRLDADQYVPYPLEDVNLDFEVLGPSLVSEGMVQVLLAASRSENVDQRVDALAFGGMQTKVMDIESHAIERAFGLMAGSLPNTPELVALVDIGHNQTTLYVAKNGEFIYSREQLFGGVQLTEAIQNRYGLSAEEAAISKRERTLPDDYYPEVLTPFIENTIQQITRSLQFYFSSSQYSSIDHVILAGGSSSIAGLAGMAQQKLGVTVSVANPFTNMTIAPNIDNEQLAVDAPSLMAACGLALRSFD
ncbi:MULTISPECIES: type IV pilus assembly protein PilM [unclassified Psychrobacter]|uniref:type IV pilus assembly protein PilM n=1 Tax=unclassified Psychrobacter TaxID=196806 RepID=UPI0025B3E404|nr:MULTISPECIES: type IV pilus assembly protein PilM [unclassified Psychrobacter]MDN3452803.1 type IV pilus assembly protein PilM [Psychrobacter sp. APC 3350]MDN3503344.1 type IV pilus assembly protein PilM [Psychrobacter sp. 5A.1]